MIKATINKDYFGQVAVSIFSTGHAINEMYIFRRPEIKAIKEGEIVNEPSLLISEETLVALKEAIRIYEGNTPDFSQGQLKATQYHLEDLRKLLKINK